MLKFKEQKKKLVKKYRGYVRMMNKMMEVKRQWFYYYKKLDKRHQKRKNWILQ